MIICANKMEYPLRSQCQKRVQKQATASKEKERASLTRMTSACRGGADAVWQQMASHPQYLDSFLRAQHYILHMDGPLPLPCRHYIAIMAAARHCCNYLVYLHSAHFLRLGGDPLWLQGLEAAPPRLHLLDHINKVLAHQPWLAACSHIKTLLKCGETCWSLAELVQAVVILAHCHSLCSFVFAAGAANDSAHPPAPAKCPAPNGTPPAFCAFDAAANGNNPNELDNSAEQMTRRWSLDSSEDVSCLKERIQRAQEEQDKREERLLHADVEDDDETMCSADPSRFVTDPDFGYQEFTRRDDDDHFQVFRVQDYSWEDHGFSLANRLYSDVGHLLDERFRHAAAVSSPRGPELKRAVWNYIHCVLGIRYDDYDYGEVDRLLEPDLQVYIKTVACFPDAGKNPPRWTSSLKTSERTHVNLLVMEARLQAELLYALRAITQYMIT
ncbi:sestrin-3 isoform X2 [Festucalex cinctus]